MDAPRIQPVVMLIAITKMPIAITKIVVIATTG
jgi:hypothetical protein